MRRDVPSLAVVGDHGDRLAVVFDQGREKAAALMLEADPLAKIELHHLDVSLHRFEHLQPRHHARVQLQQFLEAQAVDVNGHGRGPSAGGWRRSVPSRRVASVPRHHGPGAGPPVAARQPGRDKD